MKWILIVMGVSAFAATQLSFAQAAMGGGMSRAMPLPLFSEIDTDESGTLSLAEVMAAMPSDTNFADVFKRWDLDADGSVSLEEFPGDS